MQPVFWALLLVAWLAALLGLMTTSAVAQRFELKEPEVKKGESTFEFENSAHAGLPSDVSGLDRTAHETRLNFGLTDYWRLSPGVEMENPADDSARLSAATVENIFVLMPIGTSGLGIAWFTATEIALHPDTTNSLIFGPIVRFKTGALSTNFNPFFERTFGQNHEQGIALDYRWQAKLEVQKSLGVGVEAFGNIENLGDPPPLSQQQHRLGPVVYWQGEIAKGREMTVEVGPLFGLTAATPRFALKLNVEVPFSSRK
jgi:hypothetical protein